MNHLFDCFLHGFMITTCINFAMTSLYNLTILFLNRLGWNPFSYERKSILKFCFLTMIFLISYAVFALIILLSLIANFKQNC